MFPAKRQKPLVLHIDDEPSMLGFVRVALEDMSVDVLSISDPADGVKKASNDKPDLILLDVCMPFTDGFEICRNLKQKFPELKIVMMTALGQMKDVEKALANGADGYILKPFTIQKLKAKVCEILKIPERKP